MTPQETLLKHEDLINLVIQHQYIPHHSQLNFRAIVQALKEINPKGTFDVGCQGCTMDIIRIANIHLTAYKASLSQAQFHTFPKQDPPEEVKRKPGRPKKK